MLRPGAVSNVKQRNYCYVFSRNIEDQGGWWLGIWTAVRYKQALKVRPNSSVLGPNTPIKVMDGLGLRCLAVTSTCTRSQHSPRNPPPPSPTIYSLLPQLCYRSWYGDILWLHNRGPPFAAPRDLLERPVSVLGVERLHPSPPLSSRMGAGLAASCR